MFVHHCARFKIICVLCTNTPSDKLKSTSTYVHLPDINLQLTTCGVVYKPDIEKGITCCVYAKCSGGWNQENADNAENLVTNTGYVITYYVCPVLWCSKLQIEIDLSTSQTEYITLNQATRKVISFMVLMKGVSFIFDIHLPKPKVFCKVSKENKSCIAVAESNKFSPRTKNIAIKYPHL